MFRTIFIWAMLLPGLLGCSAALLTVDAGHDKEYEDAGQGTVYYLPRSLLTVTVTKTKEIDTSENFTIDVAADVAPDPTHRYVLAYAPNRFYSDRFCIARKSNGLLQGVQFAAEDKTQQVVFNITRFIAATATGPAPSNLTGDTPGPATTQILKMTIDPYRDVGTFNNALRARFGREVHLDLTRFKQELKGVGPNGYKEQRTTPQCKPDEICYLTKRKVPVELKTGTTGGKAIAVAYVEVVNPFDMGSISVERAALVERVTKIWFEDGALVGVVIKKPSEAEAASLLPLNAIKAAVTTPSGLLAGAFSDTQTKIATANAIGHLQGQQSAINAYFSQNAINVSNAPTAAENRQTISCNPSSPGPYELQ
jgi:hypothetical protein